MNMEPFTWPPQWRAFWRNLSPSVWIGTTPITEVEDTGELDNIMVQNFVAHFRIERKQKAIVLKISISMPFELVRRVGGTRLILITTLQSVLNAQVSQQRF